eukprot:COSAG02_NODE_7413_length_3027_cov_3.227117_4_plen_55_part_00
MAALLLLTFGVVAIASGPTSNPTPLYPVYWNVNAWSGFTPEVGLIRLGRQESSH